MSIVLLSLCCWTSAWGQLDRHLIMVGGGTHPPAAMRQFYTWAGKEKSEILVVPWATAEPDENFEEFSRDFVDLPRLSLERAPLAPLDASSRARFLQQLENATAVWFSGGDQVKIMEVLQDQSLLAALRDKYRRGTVFAGTSAGTAIMSLRMLTGEGDVTLLDGRQIQLREGLGLLPPNVIVDQHFLKRQRENRLFGLILELPEAMGIGIDESTALVLTNGDQAQVIGQSQVMVVQAQPQPNSLLLHLFQPGDSFKLSDYLNRH